MYIFCFDSNNNMRKQFTHILALDDGANFVLNYINRKHTWFDNFPETACWREA